MDKIRSRIKEEISQLLNKQPLNPTDVDMLYKLTDCLKDVSTSEGMDDYSKKYLSDKGSTIEANSMMIVALERLLDDPAMFRKDREKDRECIQDEIRMLKSR